MASLVSSPYLLSTHRTHAMTFCTCSSACSTSNGMSAAMHRQSYPKAGMSSTRKILVQELDMGKSRDGLVQRLLDLTGDMRVVGMDSNRRTSNDDTGSVINQLYLILEAVSDRVEMHKNIGKQRENWNALLLNSLNMMTLTATTLASLGEGAPMGVKLSSTLLFMAATGMLLMMNKLQPSQLAEEQRKAVRLFKQLESEIRLRLEIHAPTQANADEAVEKLLAIDRAYPLPLLGAMLEKFPKKFELATWWPKRNATNALNRRIVSGQTKEKNGWSEELEIEMRAIIDVLKKKDEADYMRLGNKALKTNKVLAVSGPVLTSLAAVASGFAAGSFGGTTAAAIVAVSAGCLATAVNSFEHGAQVGMVVEMYRNNAGFFRLLTESIESTLEESNIARRENGELFEMKLALKLGRSLSQLRDLAKKSIYSNIEGNEMDEFGSKLF